VICPGTGTWGPIPRSFPAMCIATQDANPPQCPGSFTGLAPGSSCTIPSYPRGQARCVYPEGICACAPCLAGDGGSGTLYACKAWGPPPSGCALPRPSIGSLCTVEGQSCAYATMCGVLQDDQPDIKCVNGIWTNEPIPQPPCPLPSCSQ
jgi:hypothetical protein